MISLCDDGCAGEAEVDRKEQVQVGLIPLCDDGCAGEAEVGRKVWRQVGLIPRQDLLGIAAKTGFSSRRKASHFALNVSLNGCANQPRTKCLLRMGALLGTGQLRVHGCLIWPNAWLENPVFAETSLDFHARRLQLPPCKWIRPLWPPMRCERTEQL